MIGRDGLSLGLFVGGGIGRGVRLGIGDALLYLGIIGRGQALQELRFRGQYGSPDGFGLVLGPGVAGCNMVDEIVALRVLGGKFEQGQGSGHDGNDDGGAGVALGAMAVGGMLEVFVGLFEFFAHDGGGDGSLSYLGQGCPGAFAAVRLPFGRVQSEEGCEAYPKMVESLEPGENC